jgi:DNA topoisomerase-1
MQQEASKLLSFATSKTMLVAQRLYEGIDLKGKGTVGLVSYIRTDSVRVSDEAYEQANKLIENKFGKKYVPEERNVYKSKGRSQDAHEAIRPTDVSILPDEIKDSLNRDEYKLYKLIWERFTASQMASAIYDGVSVTIEAGKYIFKASGSVLRFNGYLALYGKNEAKEEDVIMPELAEGDILKPQNIEGQQHFTQPPARYSESAAIKTLEDMGIGRPSTYAPTISTLLNRGYAVKEKKILYPTELGEIVNDMVANNFSDIVNAGFTAKMEEELDKIEAGDVEWKKIIREFYPPFEEKIKEAEETIGEVELKYEETDIICENCGRNMVIKMSKYGKFLACPGFPECRNAKTYYEDAKVSCPKCGARVLIKKTKKGRKFYGCESAECDFISWNKPTGESCPDCGAYLIYKSGKVLKIACSNPECAFVKPAEETDIER